MINDKTKKQVPSILPVTQTSTINMTAFLPTLDDPELTYIYRLAKTVKILTLFDLFLGFLMIIYGYVGFYIIFRIVSAISGFYGAKHFDSCLSSFYLTFLIIGTIVELLLIYVYQKMYLDDKISKNAFIFGVIYQSLFFFLKAYITRFVYIFNQKINKLTQDKKQSLINYNNKSIEIIYW
jgi:hypothetical protein